MNWRKARGDLIISIASQLIYKLVGFAILATLTRYLTKDDFGAFMFALSVGGLFVLLTEFGSSSYLVREVAAAPDRALKLTSEVIVVRLPLIAAYFAVVALFGFVFKRDLTVVLLMAAVHVGLKDLYHSFASLFLGLKRIMYTVLSFGVSIGILLIAVLLVVRGDGGLRGVLGAYALNGVCLVSLGYLICRFRVGRLRFVWQPAVAAGVIRRSLPIFSLAMLGLVLLSADTVMLGFMKPYAEVAIYEAGGKLFEASQFLVRAVTLIFFPICSELVAAAQWTTLGKLLRRMMVAVLVLGLLLAGVVGLGAPLIIPAVFGEAYADAIPVLRVLYLSVPLLYVATVGTFLATAMHVERKAVVVLALGVVCNIALNLQVIPTWGALGAAWTTLGSEGLIAIGLLAVTIRALRGHETDLDFEPAELPEVEHER